MSVASEVASASSQETDRAVRKNTATDKHTTALHAKLEFMAAVHLVPPAVLEEIHRRQVLCRAELGNWWERQHSQDFCLVDRDTYTVVHSSSRGDTRQQAVSYSNFLNSTSNGQSF